jgi:ketosteroid isomerase-like protein
MSQENVKVVRTLLERWNAGDRSPSRLAEHCDPAIELVSPLSSVYGDPYRGHAGIEDWLRDLDEAFAQWRISLEDLRVVGNAVIVTGRVHGRGRESGIDFEMPFAMVAYFGTDHLITRVRIYPDASEALEAVGLRE